MKDKSTTPKAKKKDLALDQAQRLDALAGAQQKATRKVTKLRERLAQAETRLARRTARLDAARSDALRAAHQDAVPPIPVNGAALPVLGPVVTAQTADPAIYKGEREASAPPPPRTRNRKANRRAPTADKGAHTDHHL